MIKAVAERKTFPGVNGTPFSWIFVQVNGTKFAYTDFFPNIQPFPCFESYATFFQWPNFAPAGNLPVGNQVYDLYFGSDHRLWVFQNNSIPITAMDPDVPMLEFSSFSPNPPVGSNFKLPPLCFVPNPPSKRSVEMTYALPALPSGYSMSLTYYDTFGETSGNLNIYYDAVNGLARVDTPYNTFIQNQNDVYSFINPQLNYVGSISPLPCYAQLNRSYTVWASPSFEKFLGNVTVNGKPAKVLLDDRLDSTVISFWYLTYPDNAPLYFIAASTFNVVNSYQPVTPPASVFNVPSSCVTITSSQKRFNLFDTLRRNHQ